MVKEIVLSISSTANYYTINFFLNLLIPKIFGLYKLQGMIIMISQS